MKTYLDKVTTSSTLELPFIKISKLTASILENSRLADILQSFRKFARRPLGPEWDLVELNPV
jgi:hypothetical protein